jgi:hypothetical protein
VSQEKQKPTVAGLSDRQFNWLMVAFLVIAVVYCYAEWRHNRNLFELCESNGGYLVSGYEGWYCAKKEIFIPRKAAQ